MQRGTYLHSVESLNDRLDLRLETFLSVFEFATLRHGDDECERGDNTRESEGDGYHSM